MATRQRVRTGPRAGAAAFFVLPALLCSSVGTGCFFMPKEAGVRLQTDMLALRGEVTRLREQQEQEHAAKLEHDLASDAQLASIQKRLAEASQTSHVAEADMGTQLERMLEDVQKLRGAIEVNEHRIGETETKLEQRLAERLEALKKVNEQRDKQQALAAAKRAIPSGKKERLAYARKLLREQRVDEGRELLRDLANRFGKERGIGDEALLALAAESLAAEKPEVARRDYVRLLGLFPNGAHNDEAYFKIALCSQMMGRTDEARTFYNEVVLGYPKSPWTKQAKQKLQALAEAKAGSAPAPAGENVPPSKASKATAPAPAAPTPAEAATPPAAPAPQASPASK